MTHLRRLSRVRGTYFVSPNTWQRRPLFLKDPPARIFLASLFHYRDEGNYRLHAFVVMPDHFHLLLTPSAQIALERAMQLIKGGSSHTSRQELAFMFPVWQTGFDDHRIRSRNDFEARLRYIHNNPVVTKLVERPEWYPYSSAHPDFADRVDGWEPDPTSAAKADKALIPAKQPG